MAEIFWSLGGRQAARQAVHERRARWFDPALVDAFLAMKVDDPLWDGLGSDNLQRALGAAEPEERVIGAEPEHLDRIAHAFALVVDAKSSFTYNHSERVASVAEAIGAHIGLSMEQRVRLRHAGLLHDIGKLAIPNRILDKPAPLTREEWKVVQTHPYFTFEVLCRVPVFSDFAFDASTHHERLDGSGYFRGLTSGSLSQQARILATADVFDALSAERPYRAALPPERVLAILRENAGEHLCPTCVDAVCEAMSTTTPPAAR